MRTRTSIRREMKRANELSKEIIGARHTVPTMATHGIVLGSLYTLAWVLGLTEDSPVDYARKRFEAKK